MWEAQLALASWWISSFLNFFSFRTSLSLPTRYQATLNHCAYTLKMASPWWNHCAYTLKMASPWSNHCAYTHLKHISFKLSHRCDLKSFQKLRVPNMEQIFSPPPMVPIRSYARLYANCSKKAWLTDWLTSRLYANCSKKAFNNRESNACCLKRSGRHPGIGTGTETVGSAWGTVG